MDAIESLELARDITADFLRLRTHRDKSRIYSWQRLVRKNLTASEIRFRHRCTQKHTDEERTDVEHNIDFINGLTEQIIGCSFKVLNTLGTGFLEKVYQNALAYELARHGHSVAKQCPIHVFYEGVLVGDFIGDLVVEGQVIVELKAVREHHDRFTAQCLNYLKATGLPVCLLVNFGKPQLDIKRYAHPSLAT